MAGFKDIPAFVSNFIERPESRRPVDRAGFFDPEHAIFHVHGADPLLAEELDAGDRLLAAPIGRHID
jgi:hypothetical protein